MRFRIKKQLAFLFTVIIIAVQFPYAALAETDVRDIQTVASFSALGDDVKKQTVPIGTEQEELILPPRPQRQKKIWYLTKKLCIRRGFR